MISKEISLVYFTRPHHPTFCFYKGIRGYTVMPPASNFLGHLVTPIHQVCGHEGVASTRRRLRKQHPQWNDMLKKNGFLSLLHDLQVEGILQHRSDEGDTPPTMLTS